jgi:cation:H+ antiporter
LGAIHGLILLGVLVAGTVRILGDRALVTSLGVDVAGALTPGLGLPDHDWTWGGYVVLGIGGLAWGAELTVGGASALALSLDITEAAVAAGVIAVGTSLPELTTTLIAAYHRRPSVALGNVIGSNLLNLLAVVGVASLVADIELPTSFFALDLWVMLAATVALWLLIRRGQRITRRSGGVFLLAYLLYLFLIF